MQFHYKNFFKIMNTDYSWAIKIFVTDISYVFIDAVSEILMMLVVLFLHGQNNIQPSIEINKILV